MRTTPAGESRYSTDATLLHDHGLRVRFTAGMPRQYQQEHAQGREPAIKGARGTCVDGRELECKGAMLKDKAVK